MLRAALGVSLGLVASAFLGYCVYFDHQRRSAPDYHLRLRERRTKAKQKKRPFSFELPDVRDPSTIQRFFVQEINVAESALVKGDVVAAVDHLAKAVCVCDCPEVFLDSLTSSLPHYIVQELLLVLPHVRQRMSEAALQDERYASNKPEYFNESTIQSLSTKTT